MLIFIIYWQLDLLYSVFQCSKIYKKKYLKVYLKSIYDKNSKSAASNIDFAM